MTTADILLLLGGGTAIHLATWFGAAWLSERRHRKIRELPDHSGRPTTDGGVEGACDAHKNCPGNHVSGEGWA